MPVNINRAGRQQKAFWRAEEKHVASAASDPLTVVPDNTAYHFDCERRRSFAAGWIAAVEWTRRERRRSNTKLTVAQVVPSNGVVRPSDSGGAE